MENQTPIFKNGKPSISIRAIYIYHGYVRNRGYLQNDWQIRWQIRWHVGLNILLIMVNTMVIIWLMVVNNNLVGG
jgi:hypothetical protein